MSDERSNDKNHEALPRERLKTEAERWIACVTTDGSTSGAAAHGLRDLIQRAALAEYVQSATQPPHPAAWIEHHKGGDNLVWEQTGDNCTPLYKPAPSSATPEYEIIEVCAAHSGKTDDPVLSRVGWLYPGDEVVIRRKINAAPQAVNEEGPEELCPKPAPGLAIGPDGVLRPAGAAPFTERRVAERRLSLQQPRWYIDRMTELGMQKRSGQDRRKAK